MYNVMIHTYHVYNFMYYNIKLDPIGVSKLNLIDNQIYTPISVLYFPPAFEERIE